MFEFVKGDGLPSWFDPNVEEYEIACEGVRGEEPVFKVNGKEVLNCFVPVSYTNEEIDSWSDLGKPYKIYQHKEYDPATNSMNISKDGNRS